jgi:hypothetical protein
MIGVSINSKYFTTGYIYLYSIALATLDALTISREKSNFFDFEVFSMRVVVVFTFWLVVKNFAGLAEKRGHSYKLAMILALVGLPVMATLFSLVIVRIF